MQAKLKLEAGMAVPVQAKVNSDGKLLMIGAE
jgi:hypothetical protein